MIHHENKVNEAFSAQSGVFDATYSQSTITNYMRSRIRQHVEAFLPPKSRILELNAGTGVDAFYFASKGHSILATDVSDGMINEINKKIAAKPDLKVKALQTSYHDLTGLDDQTFDYIYSNFGGLNCTDNIVDVLQKLPNYLKPGGIATLIIMPPFCLWESGLALKGNFKIAFRRWSKKGAKSHIEGKYFTTWYYRPNFIKKSLAGKMKVIDLEGLCSIVPPEYLNGFVDRRPNTFERLKKWEHRKSRSRYWRSRGDYYIITLQKPIKDAE